MFGILAICRYYETVGIMGLSDIHTNEDGSFRFGGNCIIPNYSYLPAKLDLLTIYLDLPLSYFDMGFCGKTRFLV